MTRPVKAIGMMSGTSMDGIDVALIETDGEATVRRLAAQTYPYDRPFRQRIGQALGAAAGLTSRTDRPAPLDTLETDLTAAHADALAHFLAEIGENKRNIEVVGFHGQTVLHRPEQRLTVQLGDGPLLARLTGLTVAYDLRADDVAAGGQGAPLAPAYHRAMVAGRSDQAIAVLNIGGVANVTWIGPGGELLAFDTGPGNALIDDWMAKRIGASRDEGGAAALAGSVQDNVVAFFLNHDYFKAAPPKSLDRNAFFWDLVDGLSVEDGAATLAAMAVGAIAAARAHLPAEPRSWVVCGGGRHNAAIMRGLAAALRPADVVTAEALGFDGDSVEAEAWAYLAVRAVQGLAITFPGTTGVAKPMTGGRIARPT